MAIRCCKTENAGTHHGTFEVIAIAYDLGGVKNVCRRREFHKTVGSNRPPVLPQPMHGCLCRPPPAKGWSQKMALRNNEDLPYPLHQIAPTNTVHTCTKIARANTVYTTTHPRTLARVRVCARTQTRHTVSYNAHSGCAKPNLKKKLKQLNGKPQVLGKANGKKHPSNRKTKSTFYTCPPQQQQPPSAATAATASTRGGRSGSLHPGQQQPWVASQTRHHLPSQRPRLPVRDVIRARLPHTHQRQARP